MRYGAIARSLQRAQWHRHPRVVAFSDKVGMNRRDALPVALLSFPGSSMILPCPPGSRRVLEETARGCAMWLRCQAPLLRVFHARLDSSQSHQESGSVSLQRQLAFAKCAGNPTGHCFRALRQRGHPERLEHSQSPCRSHDQRLRRSSIRRRQPFPEFRRGPRCPTGRDARHRCKVAAGNNRR